MSQVDYDQKIQEINKLKISDAEKSRRIRVLLLQRKQAGEVKTAVNKPDTMKAAVNKPMKAAMKPDTMKAAANNPIVKLAGNNNNFREQLHAIRLDESLSNEEKHDKIQALTGNKPQINTAAIQESIERIRNIHAIRKQNLNPVEKINKIKALKSNPVVRHVVQQLSIDPIKAKITALHKENISLDEKKIKLQALLKERYA